MTPMRTRLTDLLGHRAPGDARGHGRRLLRPPGRRGLGRRRVRLPRGLHHGPERMLDAEMAAVRGATDRPFGVDLLTAMPGGLERAGRGGHRGRRQRVRRRPRRPRRGRRPLPPPRRAGRQHVREGRPRASRRRCRVRPRRRPGNRGRRAHRAGRHACRSSPRWSTPSVTGCRWSRPGASSTAGGSPPPWRSAPTACGWARGSSPRRKPARWPATRRRSCTRPRGRHHRQPGLLRQDHARPPQRLHRLLRGAPGRARAFPDSSAGPTRWGPPPRRRRPRPKRRPERRVLSGRAGNGRDQRPAPCRAGRGPHRRRSRGRPGRAR